jgi:NitT/TauT family transport system substrate-binding protein
MTPTFTVKARVGNSLTTAPFWYAIEKGYLEQLGLKFEQVDIANAGDVVAPLATGQIDLAGTSFGSGLYNAVNRDIPVKAVADNGQLAHNLAGAAAVVKKGELSKYGTDWCGMKGKKVAVVSRTTGLFVTLVKALEQCHLTESEVQVVELGFAETNAAIANGSVDVAFQVEPFVSRGVQAGLLELWKPLDEAYQGQQMNMLLYSPGFLKNQEAALRFMVAYLAGARDYRRAIEGTGSKEEMGRILAKYLNVPDPKAFNNMIMMGVDPNGKLDMPSVQQSLQIFQDTGAVPKGAIKLDWISDDFRNQALEYLGPYQP